MNLLLLSELFIVLYNYFSVQSLEQFIPSQSTFKAYFRSHRYKGSNLFLVVLSK